MKKGITLGIVGLGAIALGETKEESVVYSIKPKVKGGKCTADVKGIKESEGKKLTGFKCNLSEKDKELFAKAGLSKLKTITIYNKDTQQDILNTLSKINKDEKRFQFDVNFIVRQGLAKDSQTKPATNVKKTNPKPVSNIKTRPVVSNKNNNESTLKPRIIDKITNKKQGNDKDFVLDVGAFDSKLRCFIPARNVKEILKNDGRFIYVDCHKRLGKEMLKGFSNRIEITDKELRQEIVEFIRDFHNEHTPLGARYIDTMDVPTDAEIKEAKYNEIPLLIIPYPASYKESLDRNKAKENDEVTKIIKQYKNKFASK